MQQGNPPIRVFVHLAHGFGAATWRAKWQRGEIIGLNDRLPYGYFWAEEDGCTVTYSEDRAEGAAGRLLRLGLRFLFGFDLLHAWRNRRGICNAEIVWTHTESQHLAVLMLLRCLRPRRRPEVIAQSVWLFDIWPRLSPAKRWLYRRLLAEASVLTVLSPANLRVARALFPRQRAEMIPFGIRAEGVAPKQRRPAHRPIRVLSLGNDRHRDWSTLVAAVRGWADCELRVVTPRLDAALADAANVEVVHPKTNDALAELYDWADLVALALTPNLHASGITVIEEATLFGLPVICTETGGLEAYFSPREVRYVPAGDPAALREAIAALAADDAARLAMAERAYARLIDTNLTSRGFAQRHAALSRELVRGAAATAVQRRSIERATQPAALLIAVGCCLVTFHADAAPSSDAVLDLCRFRPTLSEDFDTLSVSARGEHDSRWIAHTPWNGDFGDAAFADPRADFPFRVRDGVLEIEARKGPDGKWQSGLLASATPTNAGFAQRYGYFEMRAELPPGPGTWPGFWLNSNQPPGSKQPGVEIDVIEYYGQFPDGYHSAVHVWDKVDPRQSRVEDHVTSVPSGSLVSGFHTYGVDVEPDWITFYLDRRETWRVATPPELRDPSMVLVNLALGSGWPIDHTPNPSIMKIDYVHVFARRDGVQPVSGGCDGGR